MGDSERTIKQSTEVIDDWLFSPEKKEAATKFNQRTLYYIDIYARQHRAEEEFHLSQEFANARLAFKERING